MSGTHGGSSPPGDGARAHHGRSGHHSSPMEYPGKIISIDVLMRHYFTAVRRVKADDRLRSANDLEATFRANRSLLILFVFLAPDDTPTKQCMPHHCAVYNNVQLMMKILQLVVEYTASLVETMKRQPDMLRQCLTEAAHFCRFSDKTSTFEHEISVPAHELARSLLERMSSMKEKDRRTAMDTREGSRTQPDSPAFALNVALAWAFDMIESSEGRTHRWWAPESESDVPHKLVRVLFERADVKKRTPLHLAVWNNHIQSAECLVTKVCVNLDLQEGGGYTALYFAVYKERFEMVKLLLRNGASIAITSDPPTRLTPLNQGCILGKKDGNALNIVGALLGCIPDCVPRRGMLYEMCDRDRPRVSNKDLAGLFQELHMWQSNAAPQADASKALLGAGGHSPLDQLRDCVKELSAEAGPVGESNADTGSTGDALRWTDKAVDFGQSAHSARMRNMLKLLDLVSTHFYPPREGTGLEEDRDGAAHKASVEFQFLGSQSPEQPVLRLPRKLLCRIMEFFHVNVPDERTATPLISAVRNRRPSCMRLLLLVGADPNVPNKDGDTALHVAVNANLVAYVKDLIRLGQTTRYWETGADLGDLGRCKINLHCRNKQGFQPLDSAQTNQNAEIAGVLRSAGAAEDEEVPAGQAECAICTQTLLMPTKLECEHWFCLSCITTAFANAAKQRAEPGHVCPFRCEGVTLRDPIVDEEFDRFVCAQTGHTKRVYALLKSKALLLLHEFQIRGESRPLRLNETDTCNVEIHNMRFQFVLQGSMLVVAHTVMPKAELAALDEQSTLRVYSQVLDGNLLGSLACSGGVGLSEQGDLSLRIAVQLDLARKDAAKEVVTVMVKCADSYKRMLAAAAAGKPELPEVLSETPSPDLMSEIKGNYHKANMAVECMRRDLLKSDRRVSVEHDPRPSTRTSKKERVIHTWRVHDPRVGVSVAYEDLSDLLYIYTRITPAVPQEDDRLSIYRYLIGGDPERPVDFLREQLLPNLHAGVDRGGDCMMLHAVMQLGNVPHTKLRDCFDVFVQTAQRVIAQLRQLQAPDGHLRAALLADAETQWKARGLTPESGNMFMSVAKQLKPLLEGSRGYLTVFLCTADGEAAAQAPVPLSAGGAQCTVLVLSEKLSGDFPPAGSSGGICSRLLHLPLSREMLSMVLDYLLSLASRKILRNLALVIAGKHGRCLLGGDDPEPYLQLSGRDANHPGLRLPHCELKSWLRRAAEWLESPPLFMDWDGAVHCRVQPEFAAERALALSRSAPPRQLREESWRSGRAGRPPRRRAPPPAGAPHRSASPGSSAATASTPGGARATPVPGGS